MQANPFDFRTLLNKKRSELKWLSGPTFTNTIILRVRILLEYTRYSISKFSEKIKKQFLIIVTRRYIILL